MTYCADLMSDVIMIPCLVWLLLFCVCESHEDPHTLQYFYTALTPGTQFPEFTAVVFLDGRQVQYYDSESKTLIPKTEWMKKHENENSWKYQTLMQREHQILLITNLKTLLIYFNKSIGHHTMQRLYGCDWYNNGTIRGYELYGFDGEDLISLDLKALTWTPDNKTVINNLNVETERYIRARKNQLEVNCVERLKDFMKSSVKVPPEVQVFQQQHSSSAELVCHATGFFPRAVNLTWQKDGEKMENEVEVRETLPNQDGSFQKRIILRVSPEDQKENNYTCVVQHSGLKEVLIKEAPADESNKSQNYTWISIAAPVVTLVVGLAGVLYCIKTNIANQRNPANPAAQPDKLNQPTSQTELDPHFKNGSAAENRPNDQEPMLSTAQHCTTES